MDLTQLQFQRWFPALSVNQDGVWTVASGRCAVGVVLFARQDQQFVAVRKSAVKGYEFSDQLVLPGGLVRNEDGEPFSESLERSLTARANDEAGLPADVLKDAKLFYPGNAPVTRYTAKGAERFTMVLEAHANVQSELPLKHSRRSISEAFFESPPLRWESFAPANRLIIARALADKLPAAERQRAYAAIKEALAFCNAAAEAVALPPFEAPWPDSP